MKLGMPEGGLELDSVLESKEVIDFHDRSNSKTRGTRAQVVQIWYRVHKPENSLRKCLKLGHCFFRRRVRILGQS